MSDDEPKGIPAESVRPSAVIHRDVRAQLEGLPTTRHTPPDDAAQMFDTILRSAGEHIVRPALQAELDAQAGKIRETELQLTFADRDLARKHRQDMVKICTRSAFSFGCFAVAMYFITIAEYNSAMGLLVAAATTVPGLRQKDD